MIHADVLISAGHEGRPASCKYFPQHKCNLGAAGERQWTPIVADEATRILRARGVKVVRLPADFAGTYDVKEAVFIHFDGASPPCTSRASIGYPPGAANVAAAERWRRLYSKYWPFGFMQDNFTDGLREYYAYKQVHASDGVMTLEFGELTCPKQHAWLVSHLRFAGATLGYFLGNRIGAKPG